MEKGAVVENCILMQRTAVQPGATLRHVIADKNVRINPGRMLMGHETYPLVIPKNEIVQAKTVGRTLRHAPQPFYPTQAKGEIYREIS